MKEMHKKTTSRTCVCEKLLSKKKWCPDPESNQGHGDFQSPALPTELSGHTFYSFFLLVGLQGLEPGTCRL